MKNVTLDQRCGYRYESQDDLFARDESRYAEAPNDMRQIINSKRHDLLPGLFPDLVAGRRILPGIHHRNLYIPRKQTPMTGAATSMVFVTTCRRGVAVAALSTRVAPKRAV